MDDVPSLEGKLVTPDSIKAIDALVQENRHFPLDNVTKPKSKEDPASHFAGLVSSRN